LGPQPVDRLVSWLRRLPERTEVLPASAKSMQLLGPLADAARRIQRAERISLDLSNFEVIYFNEAIVIGGLAALIRANGGTAELCNMRPAVRRYLQGLGVLPFVNRLPSTSSPGIVPFHHHSGLNKNEILNYLERRWLGTNDVSLSEGLRSQILGTVWESYANAFEHANSMIGVVAGGDFQKSRKRLSLSVLDFGVGIPTKVRVFFGDQTLDAGRALKWAFEEGTSTVNSPRGLGLSILKDFLRLNGGMLRVLSNDGYAVFKDGKEVFNSLDWQFPGTLISIAIEADRRYYCLENELNR
jgi:hypothetical protein